MVYELIDGNGKVKKYGGSPISKLIFDGDYLNGKKMEMEKNIFLVD